MTGCTRWTGLLAAALAAAAAGCFAEFPARMGPIEEPPRTDMRTGPDNDVPRPDDGVDAGEDARVDPDDGRPAPELCNGVDDDRDGVVDEDFPLGTPCEAGVGSCVAEGVIRCDAAGRGTECDAVPGAPRRELCNGLDDDCSGVIDEDFLGDLGDRCTVGEGVCAADGTLECAADGDGTTCSAVADDGARTPEQCNGADDDCDGDTDESLVRSCDTGERGICGAGASYCENGRWGPCAGNVTPGDRADVCNGIDDDCDGRLDQSDLPDGPLPCANCAALIALDGCVPIRGCLVQCDPASDVRTVCAPAPEEDCDGRDEDCDGATDDDRVCGGPMVETCRLGFGWTTLDVPSPSRDWAGCDPAVGGLGDDVSCNGSQGGAFATIDLPAGVDVDGDDDRLGVSLRCSPGAVGDYIVSHCRVVLGVASAGSGIADGDAAWGPCPGARVGGDDRAACTSNADDGAFLPMPVPFDLGPESRIGVAFVCADAADPERAAALQASVAVDLAWADASRPGEIPWEAACTPLGDGDPATACASTRGDGLFRLMAPASDVDAGDRFAFRLRPIQ